MSDDLNLSYIKECMKERYKILLSRILPCRDKLEITVVENGYLLPVKKNDAKFMMGRGGVLNSEKQFIRISGIYSGGNRISLVSGEEEYPEAYIGEGYEFNDTQIEDTIQGEAVYLGFVHNHWGHFLIDFSTRLWFAKEVDKDAKLVFLVKAGQEFSFIPNINRFLELYGIDRQRIIFVNKISRFERLIIPEPSYQTNLYYSKQYLAMFESIAEKVNYTSHEKKIYFSRGVFKKASLSEFGGTLIDNSFEKARFKKIYPERCTLDEQIGFIRGADIVAGVSGTITHNMLFANEGQKLDIINKTYIMNTMQSDINRMKKLNVTYIDAYSAYYPVSLGVGPFIFELTAEFEKYLKNELKLEADDIFGKGYVSAKNFKQYLNAYERLAVNNYLTPFIDDNPDSVHYYPWKLMGEAINLHYLELHGKLRRRNIIRRMLGR